MKHIQQRARSDCGVAALAMFTDHTYEEMLELCLQPDSDSEDARPIYIEDEGMSMEHVVLQRLGLWDYYHRNQDMPVRQFHKPHFLEGKFFREIAWGRRALMMVPSLNVPGGWHFVCYDGREILDPNKGREGKKFYSKFEEVEPIEIYVYREELCNMT